jgi:general stress protein YciG
MPTQSSNDGNGGKSSRSEAARKGGMAVSRNREHMAEIGRKGGEKVSRDRKHMAEIGRKGGQK